MKLNLLRNGKTLLSNYANIDIVPGENKIQGEVSDLDNLVDAASCDDIIATNILEYYEHNQIGAIIKHWISKLSHGGTLKLTTTDARGIAKALERKSLPLDKIFDLVYGGQTGPLSYKRSMLTLDVLCATLETHGLTILERVTNDFQIFVVGKRP